MKIDIERLLCSLIECNTKPNHKYNWLADDIITSLRDQGLIYKEGQIFPELAESEDEKIRKGIINTIERYIEYVVNDDNYAPDAKDFLVKELKGQIAWLEKQGKIVEYYEDKLDRCACENFNKGYKKALEKQGEQKSDELVKEYDFHGMEFVPKFKKGDLIREKLSGRILTIKDFSYDNGLYTYDTGQFPITIQDNYEIIEQNPTNEVGNYNHKEVLQTIINEQKPADKVEPKFKVGQTIIYKGTENIAPIKMTISDIAKGQYWDDNCCIVPISDQDNWELVEQKPAWSEEDEKYYQGCLNCMKLSLDTKPYPYYNDYLWLKFLKDRYTWKPSDEQIYELTKAVDYYTSHGFPNKILNELLKQLKNL